MDRSVAGADLAAWDSEALTGALSFGFVDGSQDVEVTREVTVANYGVAAQTLTITPSFRFENDETNGAVEVTAPPSVVVPAADVDGPGTATFDVTVSIEAGLLRNWTANSGGNGANPAPLDLLEYDGYIELDNEAVDPLHLAWHVLPRQSGETTSADDTVEITGETDGLPSGETTLNNVGQNDTVIEGYSLIGESSQLPTGDDGAGLPTIDLRYAGVQTIPVPGGLLLRRPVIPPAPCREHLGAPDPCRRPGVVRVGHRHRTRTGMPTSRSSTFELAGDLSDGRNVVFVEDRSTATTPRSRLLHRSRDEQREHVLTICAEQIGLTGEDFFTPLTADLLAVDIYFTGRVTDQILGMEFSPLGERYFPLIDGSPGAGAVPATGSAELIALDFGPDGTNPSETGMLLFTDGTFAAGGGAFPKTGSPQANEALAIHVTDDLPFDDIAGTHVRRRHRVGVRERHHDRLLADPPLFCPKDPVNARADGDLPRPCPGPAGRRTRTSSPMTTGSSTRMRSTASRRLASPRGAGPHKFCPKGPGARASRWRPSSTAPSTSPDTDEDFFTDDNGIVHEDAINRIAAAGITTGCDPNKFCPTAIVNRGQMMAFLHRALGD